MKNEKIKILIADDHILFRESIESFLSKQDNIIILGTASDGFDIIKKTEELKPDLIFMDIRMPALNGINATKIIKQKFPEINIIIISALKEREYIIESLKAGSKGYILKDSGLDKLVLAIEKVMNNEYYLDEQISQEIIQNFIHNNKP